jgi:hypothetical protein
MSDNARVIQKLRKRIDRAKATIRRNSAITDRPFETPGPFVTGAAHYSPSLSNRLDRENERRAKAFREQQAAERVLAELEERLTLIQQGEVHPNGQPRADAPSRQRRKTLKTQYAEFARDYIKRGTIVTLVANTTTRLTVTRVNSQTITDETGDKWEFNEILPLDADGNILTPDAFNAAYRLWKSTQESSSET